MPSKNNLPFIIYIKKWYENMKICPFLSCWKEFLLILSCFAFFLLLFIIFLLLYLFSSSCVYENTIGLSNRPNPPPHRKSSLPKHTDVKAKFFEICHTTLSDDVKAALRLPSFDSYDWEDYEILHLMETMFVELNFIEKFHISPIRLREWLYEVYKHYNEVPFHNFRHCFCVSQMVS